MVASQNALGNFLDRFGNFVERIGQRLDVFALQRRHKSFHEQLADFIRDGFVFPARSHKFVERRGDGMVGQDALESGDTVQTFLRAGVKQIATPAQQITKAT